MKFISIQPANNYFEWQNQVFDYQLNKLGYDINESIVVLVKTEQLSDNVLKYIEKNKNRVVLVEDERPDKRYLPNIQIHGLFKLYRDHYHLIDGHRIFLHDADIVFTQYFNWNSICIDDKKAYGSDTISYIGSQYIDSKSPMLTDKMSAIVGIDPSIVRANRLNSIGAQYILPTGLTHSFWEKVEDDGNKLYAYGLTDEARTAKKPDDPYCLQFWTVSMWSILWNLWLSGIETEVHPDMIFGWPSWKNTDWDTKIKIYHNAGVVNQNDGNFFKGLYTSKSPFGQDFSYITKTDNCSYKYFELVKETGNYLRSA